MSSKPTIYLHIGAGKTGSTTIQVWLKSVESALNSAGYVIFDTNFEPGAQHDQLSNQQQYFHSVLMNGHEGVNAFHEKFRQNLAYMRTHGFHSAIMSAENLFNHWTGAHQWFTPFINECNWKIIAYVRNQPHYIISAWKEWGYWRQDFNELLTGTIHANWLTALKTWDDTFGKDNIYLGILEKRLLIDGLLHHDFAVAINTPDIIANDRDLVYANPSINNRSALLFAKIRHQYIARNPNAAALSDHATGASKEEAIAQTLKHNAKLNTMFHFKPLVVGHAPVAGTQESDAPLGLYTQQMLDDIYTMFAESNRKLLERYRPDIDEESAFPRIIQSAHTALADDDLYIHGFHIAFESLSSLDKQIDSKIKHLRHLQQQVNALESKIQTLLDSRAQIDQIWRSTTAHDDAITYLQSQIDQLNNRLHPTPHYSSRIVRWLSELLKRITPQR